MLHASVLFFEMFAFVLSCVFTDSLGVITLIRPFEFALSLTSFKVFADASTETASLEHCICPSVTAGSDVVDFVFSCAF